MQNASSNFCRDSANFDLIYLEQTRPDYSKANLAALVGARDWSFAAKQNNSCPCFSFGRWQRNTVMNTEEGKHVAEILQNATCSGRMENMETETEPEPD